MAAEKVNSLLLVVASFGATIHNNSNFYIIIIHIA